MMKSQLAYSMENSHPEKVTGLIEEIKNERMKERTKEREKII